MNDNELREMGIVFSDGYKGITKNRYMDNELSESIQYSANVFRHPKQIDMRVIEEEFFSGPDIDVMEDADEIEEFHTREILDDYLKTIYAAAMPMEG